MPDNTQYSVPYSQWIQGFEYMRVRNICAKMSKKSNNMRKTIQRRAIKLISCSNTIGHLRGYLRLKANRSLILAAFSLSTKDKI